MRGDRLAILISLLQRVSEVIIVTLANEQSFLTTSAPFLHVRTAITSCFAANLKLTNRFLNITEKKVQKLARSCRLNLSQPFSRRRRQGGINFRANARIDRISLCKGNLDTPGNKLFCFWLPRKKLHIWRVRWCRFPQITSVKGARAISHFEASTAGATSKEKLLFYSMNNSSPWKSGDTIF